MKELSVWNKQAIKKWRARERLDFENYIFHHGGLPPAGDAEIKRRLLTANNEQDINAAFDGLIVDESKSDAERNPSNPKPFPRP